MNDQGFGPDIVTVIDEEGLEHEFEVLDAIETEDGRFVALLPVYDNPSDTLNDDGELFILAVQEEDGEEMLVTIDDDQLFDQIADIFEERLSELYEIEEIEQPEELN
ncbi:MAG TPA: DUF1292 domain-containing protein [Candidatus Avimonas sp.]|nr:DUF1292 domain-containing protein [Candidatus Avimonas sp.]HQA16313.1 DUF1292 domain-containing protein [Candidatus Avimonas sp.]HQD38074.1 DUF1292 domain-containing protein [Candidatus Avimonas sp.]